MTLEMAADCVKVCKNALDEDSQAHMALFEHFVKHFHLDNGEKLLMFADMCSFSTAANVG